MCFSKENQLMLAGLYRFQQIVQLKLPCLCTWIWARYNLLLPLLLLLLHPPHSSVPCDGIVFHLCSLVNRAVHGPKWSCMEALSQPSDTTVRRCATPNNVLRIIFGRARTVGGPVSALLGPPSSALPFLLPLPFLSYKNKFTAGCFSPNPNRHWTLLH